MCWSLFQVLMSYVDKNPNMYELIFSREGERVYIYVCTYMM